MQDELLTNDSRELTGIEVATVDRKKQSFEYRTESKSSVNVIKAITVVAVCQKRRSYKMTT